MKLNELRTKEILRSLPLGKNEVIFDHIDYRTDDEDNINGVWVYIQKYRPLFLPFFEEDNFQLDLLLEQLGIESYDPDEINKAKGTVIIAHRYERYDEQKAQTFTNVSFNPRYNGTTEKTILA